MEGVSIINRGRGIVRTLRKAVNGGAMTKSEIKQGAIRFVNKESVEVSARKVPKLTLSAAGESQYLRVDKNGKFYVPANIKSGEGAVYIPKGKNQMVVEDRKTGDLSVLDRQTFKSTYAVPVSHTLIDPKNVQVGVLRAVKDVSGAFKFVPVGTKVRGAKGLQTVKEGEVVAIDKLGKPYVSSIVDIARGNKPDDKGGIEMFNLVKAYQESFDKGVDAKILNKVIDEVVNSNGEFVIKGANNLGMFALPQNFNGSSLTMADKFNLVTAYQEFFDKGVDAKVLNKVIDEVVNSNGEFVIKGANNLGMFALQQDFNGSSLTMADKFKFRTLNLSGAKMHPFSDPDGFTRVLANIGTNSRLIVARSDSAELKDLIPAAIENYEAMTKMTPFLAKEQSKLMNKSNIG